MAEITPTPSKSNDWTPLSPSQLSQGGCAQNFTFKQWLKDTQWTSICCEQKNFSRFNEIKCKAHGFLLTLKRQRKKCTPHGLLEAFHLAFESNNCLSSFFIPEWQNCGW